MIALSALAPAAAAFLALLFAQAGLAKLGDLPAAAELLDGYALLPVALVRPASLLLTGMELLLAIGLAAGFALAGLAACLALLGFAAAMALTLMRGRTVACGCGHDGLVSWPQVTANLLLAAVALLTALPLPQAGPLIIGQATLAGALLFGLRQAAAHLQLPRAA